jgi:hypothetical protein
VAERLAAAGFDPGALRPWIGKDGRTYVTRTRNGKAKAELVGNAATLTKDQWILLDQTVVQAVRARMRAFADLRASGLVYTIPNGMAHTILQWQTVSDISRASVSMDPKRRSDSDQPEIGLNALPLPITHKDFNINLRALEVSRVGQLPLPLDTTLGMLAGKKIAEEVERMTVGTATFSYGGGAVYGYTNLPQRITKTDMTVPTASNGATSLSEILTIRQALINKFHYGPYRLYFNKQWAGALDTDYVGGATAWSGLTLRQRLLNIPDFQSVDVLDFLPLTNWNMVMVEMQPETVRAVIGMEPQVVRWEEYGGFELAHKAMCIMVPQVRPDSAGGSGIGHGTSATP